MSYENYLERDARFIQTVDGGSTLIIEGGVNTKDGVKGTWIMEVECEKLDKEEKEIFNRLPPFRPNIHSARG